MQATAAGSCEGRPPAAGCHLGKIACGSRLPSSDALWQTPYVVELLTCV